MEQIQSDLRILGYDGNVSEDYFNYGSDQLGFINIVTWLSSQLVNLCEFESHITHAIGSENYSALEFNIELSSLLKELCCPYKSLTTGNISDRLLPAYNKILLINYICTELKAAKIQAFKNPIKKTAMKITLEESKTAKELREMLICLGFPKPPKTITPKLLFSEVEKKLYMFSPDSTPRERVGDLLFSGCLTEKQWFQLEDLYKEMYDEYKTRKNLLLTRLNVTIESFLWAERLKNKNEEITNIYNRKKHISDEPSVKVSDILAAKSDLTIIQKTSSASVRKNTKSSVNNVVIGSVPDRGGRPEEQQPPPPEVPSWQKNDSSNRSCGRPSSQQSTGCYKNTGYYRDENSNNRSKVEQNYKGDNYSRGNYRSGRNDANIVQPPVYSHQPVNYYSHIGFGGYTPAGDNFQQYGMPSVSSMNEVRISHGTGHRGGARGGYFNKSSNQSQRRFRGNGRDH